MQKAAEEVIVTAKCNWLLSGGCDISKAVQTKITHEDIFIKPNLGEILSEDNALLLKRRDSGNTCDLEFMVCPQFKIESLSLVCNASKLEVLLGTGGPETAEYNETLYGTPITDETMDDDTQLLTFRFDIEVERSGIIEMILKMFTTLEEICIFGIYMQVAPNPHGITTLLSPSSINFGNVEQMLSNSDHKLSENAELFKKFMHSYTKKLQEENQPISSPKGNLKNNQLQMFDAIKIHLDKRMLEMETKIMERLNKIEVDQKEKFDKILNMLEAGGHPQT